MGLGNGCVRVVVRVLRDKYSVLRTAAYASGLPTYACGLKMLSMGDSLKGTLPECKRHRDRKLGRDLGCVMPRV